MSQFVKHVSALTFPARICPAIGMFERDGRGPRGLLVSYPTTVHRDLSVLAKNCKLLNLENSNLLVHLSDCSQRTTVS